MSFILPLAILFFSAAAAPLPYLAPHSALNVDFGSSGLNSGSPGATLVSRTSSNSGTDTLSFAETGLDTGLSSTLNGLASANSALGLNLGAWVSSSDLVGYLGADTLNLAIPATCLVVQTGQDAQAWVSFPEDETSSQDVADLASLSWILLDDLVSDLNENSFVLLQSVLVAQEYGSSDTAVYVSLEDANSALNALSLDHIPDSFLSTDILGVSSDLGLGKESGTVTENPSLVPYLDASTQVGSETDLSASNNSPKVDTNIVADSTSDVLTSTSSTLSSGTNLVDDLNSSVDVGVASYPEPPSAGGVSCV